MLKDKQAGSGLQKRITMALMRQGRSYEQRPESLAQMQQLETRYQAVQKSKGKRRAQGTRQKAA